MCSSIWPNFLIIGAAKAATTTLSSMLSAHPEAAIVQGKEPHFFSYDRVYSLGWERYQRLFSHCHGRPAVGDASTSYSRIRYHPETLSRIRRHVPGVRIIYMVRHPLERMVSAYVERLATPGVEHVFDSVNDAVRRQPMIIDSSRYWEVFEAYRRHFEERRIKIIWFEEFVKEPQSVFADVCGFLGIRTDIAVDLAAIRKNTRDNALDRMVRLERGGVSIETVWDERVRQWVIEQIRDDNTRFLDYFGRPRDYWGGMF